MTNKISLTAKELCEGLCKELPQAADKWPSSKEEGENLIFEMVCNSPFGKLFFDLALQIKKATIGSAEHSAWCFAWTLLMALHRTYEHAQMTKEFKV